MSHKHSVYVFNLLQLVEMSEGCSNETFLPGFVKQMCGTVFDVSKKKKKSIVTSIDETITTDRK